MSSNNEESCQNKGQEMNASFKKVTYDFLEELEAYLKTQRKNNDEQKHSLLNQIKQFNDDLATNENLQSNDSDFKKVDMVLSYGRPPALAPESKISTASKSRECEQVPYKQVAKGTSIKDACNYNNQKNSLETTASANNRVVQSKSINPNINRICIRSIDPDGNYDDEVNKLHEVTPNENENKKWNDYYNDIRLKECNLYNHRKEFQNDDADSHFKIQNHCSVSDSKNKSLGGLGNRRNEKLEQEPIILPSKQMQTFYNGLKIWQTPRDLIWDSTYAKIDERKKLY